MESTCIWRFAPVFITEVVVLPVRGNVLVQIHVQQTGGIKESRFCIRTNFNVIKMISPQIMLLRTCDQKVLIGKTANDCITNK